jgi:uncharacterized protein involved in outer membrane biogenesis
VIVVITAINSIVKKGVEAGATDSLNLQTTLGSANVSLFGGKLGLNDLEISSPPGFAAPKMFTLGGVNLGVSLGQLSGDPIGVDQIVIDKPNLVIEQAGGKFNFQVLMGQTSKQPPDAGKPGDGKREPGEPVRMVIHDLQLNNASVVLRPGIPGMKDQVNVLIPSLQMKDVGSGAGNKNGAAIKEIVMDVVTALTKKASESKDVPPEVRTLLSMNADQIKQELNGEANKEAMKLENALDKKLPGAGGAMEKELGGLFGGKKPTTQGAR